MGRRKNTAKRRAEIVEGMLEVMAVRGYDGASVQAIAKAAGLTSGLVHYHFGSKREILVALVEELASRLRRRFDALLGEAGDEPWAALDAFIDAHLALGADADPRAVACWVRVGAEALRDDDVRHVYRRAIEEQLGALEQLLAAIAPALGEDQRRAHGAALLSAVQGSYQLALVAEAVPPGSAAPTLRALARGLLSCTTSSERGGER